MPPIHPAKTPSLVYANSNGEIVDFPELLMAGKSGAHYTQPDLEDLIPLPHGSELFTLPDRQPVGLDSGTGEAVKLADDPIQPGRKVQAVAAFMSPAHTATHTTAFERNEGITSPLPLFAYTAVGWHKGKFWVSAFRCDNDCRQDADQFDQDEINRQTLKKLKKHQNNRLIQHLGKCCLTYGCPAARNYFLGRWEAPLPSSPVCNADCVGCISLQPSGCCPSTQDRINFIPSAQEIAEIAISHLNKAPRPVVSFGQGCEGEPLLQAETIEKAIKLIRSKTSKGTINLNSNSSLPKAVKKLAEAGLDSIRVSINSARTEYHSRYYRPKGFDLDNVCQSITEMKKLGKFVSLNYFILPGFTDDPSEYEALAELLKRYEPDLIQLRNLNMDPDYYFESLRYSQTQKTLGIRNWFIKLQKEFPKLRFGYFNPPLQ